MRDLKEIKQLKKAVVELVDECKDIDLLYLIKAMLVQEVRMALTEIRYITRNRHPEKVVMASSRGVASTFNTNHEAITDIIGTLFNKTRQEVPLHMKLGRMFETVSIVDNAGKKQVDYYMNKDGFLLVMMKLTGNGNLEKLNLFWVVEYLNAFNSLQEQLIKNEYKEEYYDNAPDHCLLISDILSNASMQGTKKLEAALAYFEDYIPDRLHEIYNPFKESRKASKRY